MGILDYTTEGLIMTMIITVILLLFIIRMMKTMINIITEDIYDIDNIIKMSFASIIIIASIFFLSFLVKPDKIYTQETYPFGKSLLDIKKRK